MKKWSITEIRTWLGTHLKAISMGVVIASIAGLSIYAVAINIHKKIDIENNTAPLLAHLNTIQNRLSTIEHVVSHTDAPNLEPIKQQLSLLSERINTLQTINPKQLAQTEQILHEQLNTIQNVVNHLDKTTAPIKYLAPKELPFHVLSLDSIQHIPVASVHYDFKVIPLEKEDSLASWKLIRIDYAKQQLEFENSKKERILITREQIG